MKRSIREDAPFSLWWIVLGLIATTIIFTLALRPYFGGAGGVRWPVAHESAP
jgi:hypothetical protein